MILSELFQDLFEYNQQMNELFIRSLQSDEEAPDRADELMSHLLNTHHIWLSRILKETYEHGIWDVHLPAEMRALNKNLHQKTFQLLESDLIPANQLVVYRNTKGQLYQNQLHEILMHVINHSTHHRGQVALLIRQKGVDPPVSDYIFFKRQ
ncbi:MAG: hypothetical protein HC892_02515 [Saprospiraceae bacterium]|nr:hypothetical protein [Saprospiraceae bacterium]